MNEREIIALFQGNTDFAGGYGLLQGIGDDCAVIKKNEHLSWLVTMDTLVEKVHFDLHWHPPEKLARKSVAVNISDIAAMGGKPLFVFLSLGLPDGFDPEWLRRFSQGMAGACAEYSCLLAGGDTVRSLEGVVITITVIGEAAADQVVYRSGALPGDAVWVSGTLGMAAAGLEICRAGLDEKAASMHQLVEAHLNPSPRVGLGRLLAERKLIHAMMDLSDGLATDLSHLCKQSGVGALIRSAQLPSVPAIHEVAHKVAIEPLDLMIRGGEDYELLFTADPEKASEITALGVEAGIALTLVGSIVDRPGVRLILPADDQGTQHEVDISFKGFDHFQER